MHIATVIGFLNINIEFKYKYRNSVCSTLGLQSIIVCLNDDPGLTLTYFTARSNLVT